MGKMHKKTLDRKVSNRTLYNLTKIKRNQQIHTKKVWEHTQKTSHVKTASNSF